MQNSTTSSFWASPAMQAKMAQHRARMAVAEAQLETPPPIKIQDPDQDPKKNKQILIHDLDPDGLNAQIKGQYAELLKQDAAYLKARSWGVHPSTLTNATKRMGADWVRKQIEFVAGNSKVSSKRGYCAKILASNQY